MEPTENLAATWKAIKVAQGQSVTDAISDLNTSCSFVLGRNYSQSSLSRWVRGIRHPDPIAREVMLQDVLPVLLREAYSKAEERLRNGDSIENAIAKGADELAARLK